MKPPYFIELLSRNGEVLQRQAVAALPIRLGRGYDNDFILDDAHTAAHHAVIDGDDEGRLLLRDLGGKNGSVVQGKRQDSIVLGGDTVVRLGHSRLRVRPADFPVAAELADTTMHGWEGATPALTGLAMMALFTLLEYWLSDVEAFQPIRYLLVLASGLGLGLVWSAAWALANRLFGNQARLGRHLFILGGGLLALGAWRSLSSVLAYAWSAELLTRYGNLVSIALACGMVFFHLWTIKPHHPRRMASTSLVLMLAGTTLVLMSNLQTTARAADELYMSVLLPPAVRQSADHSVDDFMAAAGKLKPAADAARSKTVKDDGADDGDDDE
ncbi:FHA domain-containing protein [Rugamonas sp. CCM 8940]|uniref:FHA domain-containing protein n=1 Tax=Rugamonas sp. CCM 8940 TaxID=2765359 RepID=UPI0018F48E17|nr:FHA domain-containing protein [Rugamonas sp. CCM 8940]MBJ7314275.1 FHA domain-containing protein [Rugamonas sp. CCM 8940]